MVTVKELQAQLKKRGLETKGLKAELIKRLEDAENQENQATEEASAAGEEDTTEHEDGKAEEVQLPPQGDKPELTPRVSHAFYHWCLKVLELGSVYPQAEPTSADWIRRYPVPSKDNAGSDSDERQFFLTPRLAYKLYKTAMYMTRHIWDKDGIDDGEIYVIDTHWEPPSSCAQFELHNDAWLRTMQAHVRIAALRLRMGAEFKLEDRWALSSIGHEVAMHCVIEGFYKWYHEMVRDECDDDEDDYQKLPSYTGLDKDNYYDFTADDDETKEPVYEFLIPESDALLAEFVDPRDWFSPNCGMTSEKFVAFQKEVSFALVDGYNLDGKIDDDYNRRWLQPEKL